MNGVLPDEYLAHVSLFAAAVFYLNKNSISQADIQHSQDLLCQFHTKFIHLYGEKHYF